LNEVPNSTLLVRAIRDKHINRQTRKIHKAAFIPRRNGKDDDGISVSQPRSDSYQQLMNEFSLKATSSVR